MSVYNAKQYQRGIERDIRALKRKKAGLESIDMDSSTTERLIEERQCIMRDFKVIAFDTALGYNKTNASELILAIRNNLTSAVVRQRGNTKYGTKYEARVSITDPNGKTAKVVTGWIVDNSGVPRLTTVYVDK